MKAWTFLRTFFGHDAPCSPITDAKPWGIRKTLAYWCEHCAFVVCLAPGETACPLCYGRVLLSVAKMRQTIGALAQRRVEREQRLAKAKQGINPLNTLTEFRASDDGSRKMA